MEKTYWLARKRQSLAMAQNADHSIARLIHYDLAGRYGIKAHNLPAPLRAAVPAPVPVPAAEPALG